MSDLAIKAENLSKVYKLYAKPIDRLKESLHPFRKKYHRDFFALKDLSFNVHKGETIGVIGKNGSGKSTLLKVLTGVLTPSSGSINASGKISALLELGAGFNPEFTGMENIYFHGSIMGFSKQQMNEKIDPILSFADIGYFVNQPVKMYSSGMFVRLAFALATNVDPDILIVDEALAVGDMRFQKKCMDRILSFREEGKTIFFCSHDMHSVGSLCERVLWMKDGRIEEIGESRKIISSYVSWMTQDNTGFRSAAEIDVLQNPNYHVRNSEEAEILSVRSFNENGNESRVFFNGDDVIFEVTYNAIHGIKDPNYSIIIFRNDKLPVCITKKSFEHKPTDDIVSGKKTFRVKFNKIELNAGLYTFGISLWDQMNKICFANNIVHEFEIRSLKIIFGPTEEKTAYIPSVDWL